VAGSTGIVWWAFPTVWIAIPECRRWSLQKCHDNDIGDGCSFANSVIRHRLSHLATAATTTGGRREGAGVSLTMLTFNLFAPAFVFLVRNQ